MIQIDINHGEIGLSYNPLGLIGDPKATVFELIENFQWFLKYNLFQFSLNIPTGKIISRMHRYKKY